MVGFRILNEVARRVQTASSSDSGKMEEEEEEDKEILKNMYQITLGFNKRW